MKALFSCLGGTNHGRKTSFKGHEIQLPMILKYDPPSIKGFGEITSAPIRNEVYTYRQFGIDGDTTYGFYCLKELSNREAMALAGIVEVPK